MRGGGINATTSRRTRDNRGGGKSDGDGNGNGECRAPLSRDLTATALVFAAEAAAALIADDANGGNSDVAIVGIASVTAGGGVLN
jgi:hypothetical protein